MSGRVRSPWQRTRTQGSKENGGTSGRVRSPWQRTHTHARTGQQRTRRRHVWTRPVAMATHTHTLIVAIVSFHLVVSVSSTNRFGLSLSFFFFIITIFFFFCQFRLLVSSLFRCCSFFFLVSAAVSTVRYQS